MDQPYGRTDLRDMKAAAPQVRDPGEPRGPRATDHQAPLAGDAAVDALMNLSVNGDAARHNGAINGGETYQGKQQAKPSDQQKPKRVVRFITDDPPGKATNGNGTGPAIPGPPPDVGLPPGWQRITHDSGLPCFVNAELQIVTWSKPYVLDAIGGDFLTMATTHVPPLSLFSRRAVGSAPAQLAAQLAAPPLRQPVEEPKPQEQHPLTHQPEQRNGTRKRKAVEVAPAQLEPPLIRLIRQGDALPLLEVNGRLVPSPENKTVHMILKDFSVAAWGRCPQYNYTKTGEPEHPLACFVWIGRQRHRTEKRLTKFLAKDAAAEAVLNEFVPEFWAEWKKSGRVDLQLKTHEQQERQHKRLEAKQEAKQKESQNAPEPKQPKPVQPERDNQELQVHAVNPQGEPEPLRGTADQAATRNVQNVRSPERLIEEQVKDTINEAMRLVHEQIRAARDQQAVAQQPARLQPTHQQTQAFQQPRQQYPDPPARQVFQKSPARQWADQAMQQNPPPPRHASPPRIKQETVLQITPKATTSMTLEEFKTLSISDPRVLQACLDLSIKTPAQVIQEYQNRHRGISVNYNTVPHEVGGEKVFKTIVTAGSTAAEGIGSSKKISKQLAAQHLLQVLHEWSATLYHEIADLYSRSNHIGGQAGQVTSVSARSSPSKKARRSPPVGSRAVAVPYAQGGQAYAHNGAARGWDGYAAYDGRQNGGWQGSPPPQEAAYGRKNERIVEYYGPPEGGFQGYYGNDPNGARGTAHPQDWGYARPLAPPLPPQPPQPPQQQQYGVYGPGAYGAAPPRPSDQYREPPPPRAQRPPYPYGPPQPPPQPRAQYDRPKGAYR